jgi:hypothetical protein
MLAEKGLMEVEAAQPPVPDENGQPQPAPVDEETAVLIYQRSLGGGAGRHRGAG